MLLNDNKSASSEIISSHCAMDGAVVSTLADSGFFKNFLHQGGVKSTVAWLV